MAITVDDLVWRSPENRTQFDDGGGRMTTTTVQPDTPGEIFPIISRQDGSYGRVHLAKVFAAVDTAGTETLYGAGAVLLEGPANTGVDVALLATGTASDRRTEARARVEAYLQKGPETRLTLFGTHYAGSRSMIAYQRPGQAVPAIGDRLFLYVTSPASEAVHKVESVEVETRVFEDDKGTFTMDVLTIGIFPALAIDYTGHSPSRYWISAKNTYILDPTVADAVRVYGLAETTATLDASGNVVMVDDVMGRICPVATKETALSLRTPAGVVLNADAGPSYTYTALLINGVGPTISFYLPTPAKRGSVVLRPGATTYYMRDDDGDGVFTLSGGISGSGTVDYESGLVSIQLDSTWGNSPLEVTYTPAAYLPVSAYSKSQSITIATKALVYLDTLTPLPGKRTVSVDYLALGQWYQLTDDGNGQLSGASSTYGTGTVDYTTGAVTVTLGYTPDLDSEVIFRWGSDVGYQQIAVNDVSLPEWVFETPDLVPGDVTVTWTSGGVSKSLAITGWTDGVGYVAGANGVLTADVSAGTVVASIAQATMPDAQTSISLVYSTLEPKAEFTTNTDDMTFGEVTASWTSGGIAKNLTITGWTSGEGSATGSAGTLTANTSAQTITLSAAAAPDSGTDIDFTYYALPPVGTVTHSAAGLTYGDVTAAWVTGGVSKSIQITGWTTGTGSSTTDDGTLTATAGSNIVLTVTGGLEPDTGTSVTFTYMTKWGTVSKNLSTTPNSSVAQFYFNGAIDPGSVVAATFNSSTQTAYITSFSIAATCTIPLTGQQWIDSGGELLLRDNYDGTLSGKFGSEWSLPGVAQEFSDWQVIGTVNYSTGEVTIDLTGKTFSVPQRIYDNGLVSSVSYTNLVIRTADVSVHLVTDPSQVVREHTVNATESIASTSLQGELISSTNNATQTIDTLSLNIFPQGGRITPDTFGATIGAHTYYDRGGVLVRSIDAATNIGTDAGTIDYDTFTATLTSWAAGGTFAVKSGLTGPKSVRIDASKFRSAGAPLREGSCSFQATLASPYISAYDEGSGKIILESQTQIGTVNYGNGQIDIDFGATVVRESFVITWQVNASTRWSATANAAGEISGAGATTGTLTAAGVLSMTTNYLPMTDSIRVTVTRASATVSEQADIQGDFPTAGTVKQTTGIFNLSFSAPILADTLRYSAVQQTTVSLNAALIGLDPLRLPITGTVPIFRDGDSVLIHHADTDTLPNPLSAGQVVNLSRSLLGDVEVRDAGGVLVPTTKYTADLDAGTLTFADPLDLSAYTQPLTCKHRIQERCTLSAVDLSGRLDLLVPPGRAFPSGSSVSSIVSWGDLMARAENVFDQVSWTGEWSNTRIGSDAAGAYNTLTHPILLTNTAAVTERWRVTFTSSTAFSVYGETIGGVGSGTVGSNFSPTNSATGLPYFTIQAGGWGTGWATGNTLRFNTIGGQPLWITRSVQPGTTPGADAFRLGLLADIDPLEA